MSMTPLDWATDGRDWSNREMSRFVATNGVDWHVQVAGSGPPMLLLHGTGAATHTWRGMLDSLARHYTVIAPDLPGQGFSQARDDRVMSLPGMAMALTELLASLELRPSSVVGHSAGAAVGARMILDRSIRPDSFIAINPALLPLGGAAGHFFSPIARMCASSPWVARLFSRFASDTPSVRRLIDSTGSELDDVGLRLYQALVANPVHVAGTLTMMANWEVDSLLDELPQLRTNTHLIIGANDRTIRPASAYRVARLVGVSGSHVHMIAGSGHLVHEERPAEVTAIIQEIAGSMRSSTLSDAVIEAAVTGGNTHAFQ